MPPNDTSVYTEKVRVKVSNGHKKSWMEICKWSCDLNDIVEDLNSEDEDEKELKESLKLQEGDKWLTMTEEVGWRWGEGSVVMTREEYENFDWENPDGFSLYDWDEAEFHEANDGCWTDISFDNIHEDMDSYDEDILYEKMRDFGDVDDCEIYIHGPIEQEVMETFNMTSDGWVIDAEPGDADLTEAVQERLKKEEE